MFDDDESTVNGDVSSLPKEESDAYGESEVVTPDPNEESPNTDQGKEDSPFHNVEFQFSEDKFEFSDEEFVAEPPKRLDPGAIIFTAKQL